MRIAFLLLMLTTRLVFGQPSEGVRGSVCGSVLDENGSPASHVRVTAIRQPGPGGASIGLLFSFTDQRGRYCIRSLELGEYVMSAYDEEKGYPHRGPLFYFWQTPDPKVQLSSLNPDARADWQIPFKAGFVKIQTLEIRTSNQTERVSFLFQVRSRPQGGALGVGPPIPAGRLLTFLLPPDEDVLLTVTCADGHKWPDDAGAGKFLHVSSGDTENITLPASCFSRHME
jgi:hypothetical protein